MPDVFLDGEKVDFADAPPASLSELRVTLEDRLAARGRVLADLRVDGQPFEESRGDAALLTVDRVEAASLALTDALAQVGTALVPEFAALEHASQSLATDVLRAPWPEVQARCLQFVETSAGALQRAVEVAALSGEESAAARAVSTLAATIEGLMRLIQQHDAAGVAWQLDSAVLPALEGLGGMLQGKADA